MSTKYQRLVNDQTGAMGPTKSAFWPDLQKTTGNVSSLSAHPLVYSPTTGRYVTASDNGAAQASISFSFGAKKRCGRCGKPRRSHRRSRRRSFGKPRYNIAYFTKGHTMPPETAFGAFPKYDAKRRVGRRPWNPPKKVSQRKSMLRKCGPKCFLDPNKDHPKFPVCNRNCHVQKRGLLSALIRARQWGYHDIAKIAQRRLSRFSGKKSKKN